MIVTVISDRITKSSTVLWTVVLAAKKTQEKNSETCFLPCLMSVTVQAPPGSRGTGRSRGWTTTLSPSRSSSRWRSLAPCWRAASSRVSKDSLPHPLSVVLYSAAAVDWSMKPRGKSGVEKNVEMLHKKL